MHPELLLELGRQYQQERLERAASWRRMRRLRWRRPSSAPAAAAGPSPQEIADAAASREATPLHCPDRAAVAFHSR